MNQTSQTSQNQQIPELPKWLKEFKQRTLLIQVIEKAFDPNVSDAEIRKMLIESAQKLEELGMPSQTQAPQTPQVNL